jgi:hypothetical protein
MALTNNLKQQVDLPVWEWCRFAPQVTTAVSSMTTGNTLGNKYIYYQLTNLLYRYDTVNDCWEQLQSTPANTPTIFNHNVLSNSVGHYGQAIGDGGGLNTIQLAGLSGNVLIGQKIRICSGTGAGQERTITAVSAPTQHERGMVTTASTTQAIDASTGTGLKAWLPNQWKNYQVRIDRGTGRTQLRPILYNTNNTLTFTDVNRITIDPWANCPLTVATVANNSFFTIESHVATVNSNWTVKPDATSRFVIMSGGIWNISQGTTAAPFFSLMYYDLISDVWYQKTTETGLKTAVFLAGSELKAERFTEAGGALVASTAVSSATARSLTTGATMTPMAYANFEIRIVDGLGIGQARTIMSNTASKFNFARDWDITPDATSKYEVWRDVGKLLVVGGNDAGMLMYSQARDQWSTAKQFDDGQANNLAVTKAGQDPIAITSITRTATGMVLPGTITAAGSGYNINDLLTLSGGTGGIVRVTSVNATGGVTGISLEACGTGYTATLKTTTAVPAGGVGCTITLAAGDIDFTELVATPIAHNFKIGDTVTIVGATGTGAAKFNGSYVIKGVSTPTTNLAFSYCSVGDPGAATATIPFSQSATVLVDATKNWTINEHAGKLIQLSTNAVLSVGQVRRIVSNTATTITWTLAATAPINGTSRYLIQDIKPFGTDRMSKGEVTGTEGFATSGSTTTLVDTTKNWETNYWSRGVGRKVRIVEGTGVGSEIPIVSNTANTLTFLTQSFSPDTTTRYVIMDTFGSVASAGGILTIAYAPVAGGTGYAVGDVLAITGGAAQAQVIAVSAGVVTGLRLITGGISGYTVATAATTNVIGTGVNCTVSVTAITAVASTSLFYDNNQNWETNYWVGSRIRFLSGTSQGNEYIVTANTANSITTAVGTAPDSSTAYAILEATPKANGMSFDCITGSTDTTLNSKYIYSFTGTATPELARYNINTEHWEFIPTFPQTETMTTGAMFTYDGADRIYIGCSTAFAGAIPQRVLYLDLLTNQVIPIGNFPYGHSTLVSGNRMEIIKTADGLKYLYLMRSNGTEMFRLLLAY